MEDRMKSSNICLIRFLESNYRNNEKGAMFKEISELRIFCGY